LLKTDKSETVQRERDILLSSNHPNIITLHQTFMDKTYLYFLLEFAENRTLADILKITSKYIFPKLYRELAFGTN